MGWNECIPCVKLQKCLKMSLNGGGGHLRTRPLEDFLVRPLLNLRLSRIKIRKKIRYIEGKIGVVWYRCTFDDDIYVQAVPGLIPVILDLRASCHPPALKNVFEFAPPQAEKKLPPRISAILPPPSRFFSNPRLLGLFPFLTVCLHLKQVWNYVFLQLFILRTSCTLGPQRRKKNHSTDLTLVPTP